MPIAFAAACALKLSLPAMSARVAAFARAPATVGMLLPTGTSASCGVHPSQDSHSRFAAVSAASTPRLLSASPTLNVRCVSCAPAFGVSVAAIPVTDRAARSPGTPCAEQSTARTTPITFHSPPSSSLSFFIAPALSLPLSLIAILYSAPVLVTAPSRIGTCQYAVPGPLFHTLMIVPPICFVAIAAVMVLSKTGPDSAMLWCPSLAARRAASRACLMVAFAGIGIRKTTEASAPMPKNCAQRRAAPLGRTFPNEVSLAGRGPSNQQS